MSVPVNQRMSPGSRWHCLLLFMLCLAFAGKTQAALFYEGVSPSTVWWPGGIVPYEFDTNYTVSAAQKSAILDGIREWELAADIHFIPRTTETNFLLLRFSFQSGVDTFTLDPPVLTIDNLQRYQLCHEMGHALGFEHEQVRPDRDNYISVLFTNLDVNSAYLYEIATNDTTNGVYDFESVMHYGRQLFSINGLDTVIPRPAYFDKYYFRIGSLALSVGDRAAATYLYGAPTNALTNIVTTTADGGFGSLRAAIYFANDHPGTTIAFNIPTNDPGYSDGAWTIKTTGELPPLVADGTVIDGGTQPGYTNHPVVFLDGSALVAEAFSSSGLYIYAASCQLQKIGFKNFSYCGLNIQTVSATNNQVLGCSFGLDATGTNAATNLFQGIQIRLDANHNIIGGTNTGDRNFISGNGQYGVFLTDSNVTGNVVIGNYIGTDISGKTPVGNQLGGVIVWPGSHDNIIGGKTPAERNVISGNPVGVYLIEGTSNNVVQGNFIGTDESGIEPLPNTDAGIQIVTRAHDNLIGGTNAGAGNLISGNGFYGLLIADAGTDKNVVQGNLIGTDLTGTLPLPNLYGIGIFNQAKDTIIGGTIPAARNLISGNSYAGVLIGDAGTSSTLVQGNFIGTAINGDDPLGNGGTAVTISSGATDTIIGGAATGAGNVISGNVGNAVAIYDVGTSNNSVLGNLIGTTADGTAALENQSDNIALLGGASGNIIGGPSQAARNVISSAAYSGIYIGGEGTAGNVIQGNFIGTDQTGTNALGNGAEGIAVFGGAQNNLIGGSSADSGNVIGANTYRGIFIADTNTSGNLVQGNNIGVGADNTTPLPNGFEGIAIGNGASQNIIGLKLDDSGAGNRIANNNYSGVYVGYFDWSSTVGNTIRGNSIYSNGYLGIDLSGGNEEFTGVTTNDIGDADSGPNNLLNFPVITNATAFPSLTIISGTLNSAANRTFLIDVYRNATADPSGHGEGEIHVGAGLLTTDDSGEGNFILTATGSFGGELFTATATDTTTGDTSEFSFAVPAVNAPLPPQFDGPFNVSTAGFAAQLSVNIGQSYRVQATTNLADPFSWIDLTNFTASASLIPFVDDSVTNHPVRFYRVVSP